MSSLRAVRRRRGVGFLFFTLVALPCIFLALMISFDATRVFLAASEARSTAQAAADAGAYQFRTNTFTIDQLAAVREARATMAEARRVGVTAHTGGMVDEVLTTSTSVRVTMTFTVRGLSPVGALIARAGFGGRFTVIAISDVCTPGRYTYTGGACARPTN